MGTFTKSFGSAGGYIAGSKVIFFILTVIPIHILFYVKSCTYIFYVHRNLSTTLINLDTLVLMRIVCPHPLFNKLLVVWN